MDPMEWVFVLGVIVLFVVPVTVLNAFAVVALVRWLLGLAKRARRGAERQSGSGAG